MYRVIRSHSSPTRTRTARPSPQQAVTASPRQTQAIELTVQQCYFDVIANGRKTWEGRLNTKRLAGIQVGDKLAFITKEHPNRKIVKVVTRIETSFSFSAMLDGKFEGFLPDASSLDEAVNVYLSIRGYSQRVAQHGAIAFQLAEPLTIRTRDKTI